jgi:predicted HicB family RNase H-like nuclease
MSRKSIRQATDKVIHIRLGERTHQKLKMHAVSSKSTIQQLVEELIRTRYQNLKVRNVKL